jgi:tRNA(Ile2) C34 agmatinyltransferase TiaS
VKPELREQRNDRYRNGLCIDCGNVPHSAGRPRCNDCHTAHLAKLGLS